VTAFTFKLLGKVDYCDASERAFLHAYSASSAERFNDGRLVFFLESNGFYS